MKKRFGKKKYKKTLIDRKLYRKWLTLNPQYKDKTYLQFKNLAKDLLKEYVNEAVNSTQGVRLSFFTGDLSVRYVTGKATDIKNSLEAEKDVKFLNFGTFGKTAKIVWNINHAKRFNKWVKYMGFSAHYTFSKKAKERTLNKPGSIKNAFEKINR